MLQTHCCFSFDMLLVFFLKHYTTHNEDALTYFKYLHTLLTLVVSKYRTNIMIHNIFAPFTQVWAFFLSAISPKWLMKHMVFCEIIDNCASLFWFSRIPLIFSNIHAIFEEVPCHPEIMLHSVSRITSRAISF